MLPSRIIHHGLTLASADLNTTTRTAVGARSKRIVIPPGANDGLLYLVHQGVYFDLYVYTFLRCEPGFTPIFVARVKDFNMRFRAKHFAGDPSVTISPDESLLHDPIDPRGSPAFIELDHTISSFNRSSFPPHLRNALAEGVLDNHLYTAFLLPYV